ncbi:uncharacterized protein [Temnothorax longispinosus]|uniref:uncharacterized protein n=1 Tax=Temnothorax longispinosus TaxID=300112 RepID=UPI003A98D665
MCHGSQKWTKLLPTVLLGLRTSIKEDIKASAAEMLYGENLTLPGEFFLDLDVPTDPSCFAQKLREYLQVARPKPTIHHQKEKVFLFKDLATCSHVFVRVDAVRRSLQPLYEGPYLVLERSDKVFKVSIKGQPTTVSIDRVKPAHLENNTLQEPTVGSQPPDTSQQASTSGTLRVYQGPKAKKIVTFAPAQSLGGGVVWRR